jgi:2-polyprenyl-3-methyl-5-hydroxy-6-metoxy-1,4-benzoquinol methylase
MKMPLTGNVNRDEPVIIFMNMKKYDLGEWPEGEVEQLGYCPLCGTKERKLLHRGLSDVLFHCAPGKWNLHQCQGCDAAYLDPRPSLSSIHLAYRNYYTHKPVTEVSVKNMHLAQRITRSLGNGYRNWRYGSSIQPSSFLGVIAAYLAPELKKTIDVSYRYLPRVGRGRRVLDVGFGGGAFLENALALGWEVAGVDTDLITVNNAKVRGLNVRHGGIEAFADQLSSFDFITINHVIEHVHYPVETLRLAHKLLKPGGRLWLDTPNINSFGYAHYRENWLGVDSPRHLVIFGWESMRLALKKSGFISLKYFDQSRSAMSLFPLSEQVKSSDLNGTNPFREAPPKANWDARMATFKSRFNKKRAEFITVLAEKS